MAVSYHDLHVSKQRLDAYAAISLSRAPDFACVGALVICHHLAVAEAYEAVDEIVGLIAKMCIRDRNYLRQRKGKAARIKRVETFEKVAAASAAE